MAGTYYSVQNLYPFIGSSVNTAGVITLSPVTLTATAADNRATIGVKGMQQLVLLVRYITGAAETNNILQMTVEFSPDGTLFYQETTEDASALSTVTETQTIRQFTGAAAATTYSFRIAIPVADLDRIRIGFAESGVVTNFGTVSVLAIASGQ